MSGICLDTSAYSHLKRGSTPVVRAVTPASRVFVPTIVLGELHAGFGGGEQRERNESELAAFLAHPAVVVAEVDEPAARHYARMVNELRRAGAQVPTNDLWIAAVAASRGVMLITCDGDFRRIPGLLVEVIPRA